MGYDPQLGGTVTSILGLILSRYDDQEHGEYNHNWQILNASVNGGILFNGVAPIPGQVLTAELVGSPPVLQASWQTPSGGGGGVSSFNSRVGVVVPLTGDYATFYDAFGAAATAQANAEAFTTSALSAYALLASPAFSGVPTAPTAILGTNTTQVATTAFVIANAGGTSKLRTARSTPISIATNAVQPADTIGYLLNFPTAFADNNYTVQVTVVGSEASGTHTIAANPNLAACLVNLQPGGVGVAVWIANNDSIPHLATINVTAWHD